MHNEQNTDRIYPDGAYRKIHFLKEEITRPNIIVGDYTYYDHADIGDCFESHVTHHYDFIGDKLIIGKFCAIARGIEFVMNGANHYMRGVTTYAFYLLGEEWEQAAPTTKELSLRGDTIVGNDVWIGQNVTVMPGVHIGDGAIIGTSSVVTKDIPPYSIAAGNPCKPVRKRFDDELIAHLLDIQWWNWPIEKIFANIGALRSDDRRLILNLR